MPKVNDNVLEGYACPRCHSAAPFNIIATATFLRVDDDGFTDVERMEWEDSSPLLCCACGHFAVARAFQINKRHVAGATVRWYDPDDGMCSRTLVIETIAYCAGGVIKITDTEGGYLECLSEELG